MEGTSFMLIIGISLVLLATPTEAGDWNIPGFPWVVSTNVSEHPPTSWPITDVQTEWVLRYHQFLNSQVETFWKDLSLESDEWSPWTSCIGCLLPLERDYFQIRYKGANESFELKKCEGMQPCLAETPFNGVTYVGCWLYDNYQRLSNQIRSDDDLTDVSITNTAVDAVMRTCATQAAQSGNQFFFLQIRVQGLRCIISNSTRILRYGEMDVMKCRHKGSPIFPVYFGRQGDPTIAVYSLFSCPMGQEQITSHGECGSLRTRNRSDSDICGRDSYESDPMLLTRYLQSTNNYWNPAVFIFKNIESLCTNFEPKQQINLQGRIADCSSLVTAVCSANGSTSLAITEWTSFDSCSQACGPNGTRARYRYDLRPTSRAAGDMVPIANSETESCNTAEDCRLVDNEHNDDLRFVGCWERGEISRSDSLEGRSLILDDIPLRRKYAVEKCKIAVEGLHRYSPSHIVLSRGECYYKNYSNPRAYQKLTPTKACSYHGSVGRGLEIYIINSNATIKSHYGAWDRQHQCPSDSDCGLDSFAKYKRSCNNPPPEEGVALNDCPSPTELLYETCAQDGCPNLYNETQVGCFQVPFNFYFVSFEEKTDKPIDCSFNAFKKQTHFAVFPTDDTSRCFTGDLNSTVFNNQTWYSSECSSTSTSTRRTRRLTDSPDSITVTVKLVSVGDIDPILQAQIESLRPRKLNLTTTTSASRLTSTSTVAFPPKSTVTSPPTSTVTSTTTSPATSTPKSTDNFTIAPTPAVVPNPEEQTTNNETLTNAQIGAIVGGTVGGAAATAGIVAILVKCLKDYDWASLISTIAGCCECGDDEEKEAAVNLTVNVNATSGTSEQANAALDEETEVIA